MLYRAENSKELRIFLQKVALNKTQRDNKTINRLMEHFLGPALVSTGKQD